MWIKSGIAKFGPVNFQQNCIVLELFVITQASKQMKADYMPTGISSEVLQFKHPIRNVLQPDVLDSGNYRDTKSRFYATVGAAVDNLQNVDEYKLILYKICADNDQVNITVVLQLDLPQLKPRDLESRFYDFSSKHLCTNSECCIFIIFNLKWQTSKLNP